MFIDSLFSVTNCQTTAQLATMNVVKYWYLRRRLLQWIGHSTTNTRIIDSSNRKNTLYQFCHDRSIRHFGYHMSAQLTTTLHGPMRVFPIAHHNGRDNNFSLFWNPTICSNFVSRYYYRHHFAASTPISKLVDRQMRWHERREHKEMVAKYGPNYRRRRPTVEKFPENMVKIEFLHSLDEIQLYHSKYNQISEKPKWTRRDEGDDTPGVFRIEWDQSSIMQLAFDYYGEDCAGQLEYYNYQTNDWKPIPHDIQNDEEMKMLYKGKGNRTMPLRLPSDFNDEQVSDIDHDAEQLTKGKTIERIETEAVRLLIRRLTDTLRREHYVRLSNTTLGRSHHHDSTTTGDEITLTIINPEQNDNEKHDEDENDEATNINTDDMTIISTKEWIIQQAEKDDFLASLLLSRPGALRHLVQCVHWDRLWK